KAQTTLDTASNLVAEASAAADFATAARLLHRGFESAKRANTATIKCSSKSSGGGKGDFMKATLSGDVNLSFSTAKLAPPLAQASTGLDLLAINGSDVTGVGTGVGISVGVLYSSVTGPGTYPVVPGSNVYRLGANAADYLATSGTITFTTYDLANQKLAGTFSFTATQSGGSGTVTVSNGSFSTSKIIQN
ncbi:MAG TPA: hypothetical protein VL171_13880, partial [Verrucomicrobiae bacterium]|nr:hypothetical protein [Verrucomicrobiae bacterium]